MSSRLITIASFDQAVDAYGGRSELERRGIPVVLVDGMTSTLLKFRVSDSGAKIQVHEEDVEQARRILLNYVSRQSDVDVSKFWRCGRCDEVVEPEFRVCWSCSRSRKEVEDRSFVPTLANVTESTEEKAVAGDVEALKLIRTPSSSPTGASESMRGNTGLAEAESSTMVIAPPVDAEELVTRAWRAAVMGLFVFPPLLNTYSMYLLIRVGFSKGHVTPKATRRFYGAIFFNVLATLAIGFYRWFEWLE